MITKKELDEACQELDRQLLEMETKVQTFREMREAFYAKPATKPPPPDAGPTTTPQHTCHWCGANCAGIFNQGYELAWNQAITPDKNEDTLKGRWNNGAVFEAIGFTKAGDDWKRVFFNVGDYRSSITLSKNSPLHDLSQLIFDAGAAHGMERAKENPATPTTEQVLTLLGFVPDDSCIKGWKHPLGIHVTSSITLRELVKVCRTDGVRSALNAMNHEVMNKFNLGEWP